MADYYPLIARAIAGLDPSAPGEARRALYERARAALIAQLRSVQPPLSESEITRERLSLEEAVRKVESEAAQRAREVSRSGSRAGDAFRAGTPRANPTKPGDPPARPREPTPPPQQRNLRPEPPSDSSPQPAPPPRPPQPSVGMQDPAMPPSRERPVTPRRPDPAMPPNQTEAPGVRGFRDIAADADDLGRAAAQANRSARKTYANVPSPTPEFDRLEPSMENRGADPGLPYSYDESAEEAARWTPPPDQPSPRPRAPDRDRKKATRAP